MSALFAPGASPLQFGHVAAQDTVTAAAGHLFGPRGGCRFGTDGPLWVADTGHHRLLGWSEPAGAGPPDLWLGQAQMADESPNRGGAVGRMTLRMPAAICAFGDGMAVADSWNHRVLIWARLPRAQREPPDLILGQADFCSASPNRGTPHPGADTLFWPSGVHCDGDCLYVADAGNRRVLIWQQLPRRDGQPADTVLGQRSMNCRDQNGGTELGAAGMVWPHTVIRWGDRLVVADAGANRVLIWTSPVTANGQPCDIILGQASPEGRLHNRGNARPSATSLAMPYAVAAIGDHLIVADTANSRLLGWPEADLASGAPASLLHGQPDFESAGDNRWSTPAPDSLCWPYGLAAHGDQLLIADTGNNRVQQWSLSAHS